MGKANVEENLWGVNGRWILVKKDELWNNVEQEKVEVIKGQILKWLGHKVKLSEFKEAKSVLEGGVSLRSWTGQPKDS